MRSACTLNTREDACHKNCILHKNNGFHASIPIFDVMVYVRKLLLGLWNIWFYVLAGVGLFLFLPFLLVCLTREKWYPGIFFVGRYIWSPIILFGMGFVPVIKYKSNIDYSKQYMFVANHLSMIDIMMVFMTIRKPAVFVGKMELDRIPIFATVYKRGAILVNRDSATSRKNVYKQAKRKLALGFNMVIYPEGLVPEPNVFMAPFKNGAFSIAIEHQIPIVPITLPDCKKRFPFQFSYKYWVGKPGVVRANVHPPFSTKGLTQDDMPVLKEKVYQFMAEKLKEEGYQ
jgi:1-acyl-sn-glycerol-3-phosphate acyltransferase